MLKLKKIFTSIIFIIILILVSLSIINFVLPTKYENIIEKYSIKYNVDKSLIFAVINAESRFKENATSFKGAKGLMQIMPDTALWIADKASIKNITLDNFFEVDNNIHLGVWYLSYLLNKYENKGVALSAYNAGVGNVYKWLDNPNYSLNGKTLHNIPFKETKNYVKKVTTLEKLYSILFKIKL